MAKKGIEIINNKKPYRPKVCLGIPTTGTVRYEWHAAQLTVIVPTNWTATAVTQFIPRPVDSITPMGYTVAEARNLIVKGFLSRQADWLLFIDHDVLIQPNSFIWADEHMRAEKAPIISGLYYTKTYPAEPLVYRGLGTGGYTGFTLGEQVWVDGCGMGFTLIHRDILQLLSARSPVKLMRDGTEYREVFVTPRQTWYDVETGLWGREIGTEDLYFCQRVIKEGILEKTRWKHLAKKKWPFLVDTRMFCWHIDQHGQRYPIDIDLPQGYNEWKHQQESQKWRSQG